MSVDLFGSEPLIPGLVLRQEFVSAGEEIGLIARIRAIDLAPFQFGSFEGKRLTRSFGWHYDFGSQSFMPAEPIPEWLLPLRARAAALAGLSPDDLLQALVIRYDPGAGIGWHKDRPVFEKVVGLSLGAATIMTFRQRQGDRRFRRVKVPLPPRSLYLLEGEVRNEWEHGIARHESLRFSITFRSLSAFGARQAHRR